MRHHDAPFEEARFVPLRHDGTVDQGCVAFNPNVAAAYGRFFLRYFLGIENGIFGDFEVVA
ncbi:MAG: hypothetical protein JO061_19660 [Acidobacteriaceae bacterium]|nr:hypothetical protein [Acidobacteriaceae bacterium]